MRFEIIDNFNDDNEWISCYIKDKDSNKVVGLFYDPIWASIIHRLLEEWDKR